MTYISEKNPLRIAIFGSFYRGHAVLDELTNGPLSKLIKIVGIVTDDPARSFVNAKNRVWQYGYNSYEAHLLDSSANSINCQVYKEKVKKDNFYRLYEDLWKPDLCIMATFGQRINSRLYNFPKLGFVNFHPSDDTIWPSKYAGPNPFSEMISDGLKECILALHEVDSTFDTGRLLMKSDRIPIPPGVTAKDMHKISSSYASRTIRKFLIKTLNNDVIKDYTNNATQMSNSTDTASMY